jgi:hypothetical protein
MIVLKNDLEYDPRQYQRDRGELDWDARSVASTDILGDGHTTLQHAKSGFYANSNSSRQQQPGALPMGAYDRYLAGGPQGDFNSHSEIELAHIDTIEQPLLSPRGTPQFHSMHDPRGASTVSLPQSMYAEGGMREAPVHRPQGTGYYQDHSPVVTPGELYGSQEPFYPPQPQHRQHMSGGGRGSNGGNMAGRGAYRG